VPPGRILTEPAATNTQENVEASRRLPADRPLTTATLVTRSYHARQALLTARLLYVSSVHAVGGYAHDRDALVTLICGLIPPSGSARRRATSQPQSCSSGLRRW
jgi:uncharacterized SAM-binding protein YcdF (DUF218 family)